MANQIFDNTLFINNQATTAIGNWPSGMRAQSLVIFAITTAATVRFEIYAGTPIFQFNYLQTVAVNSGISIVPSTFIFPLGGVTFKTAWIPTTLTACSAWIHFA